MKYILNVSGTVFELNKSEYEKVSFLLAKNKLGMFYLSRLSAWVNLKNINFMRAAKEEKLLGEGLFWDIKAIPGTTSTLNLTKWSN